MTPSGARYKEISPLVVFFPNLKIDVIEDTRGGKGKVKKGKKIEKKKNKKTVATPDGFISTWD